MKNPYELAKNILQSAEQKEQPASPNSFTSIDLYGAAVHEKGEEEENSSSFHLENESGVGDITLYYVFPGIELVYNDMHMAYCNKNQEPADSVLEINYCREGRSECLFGEHQYCYMSAGDLSFCFLQDQAHQSEFPTAHYHGITVTIDFSRIIDEMRNIIDYLAERFEISPTVMKKCFRGVYGDSVYSYMKLYRLQVVERLLKESQLNVGEIATQVGYLNPNKFTSAFCAEYGMPPTAWRKKTIPGGKEGKNRI